MIEKTFIETGGGVVARVRFVIPSSTWAETIYLVGDFNGWNQESHPFERGRDGQWVLSLDLELGHAYQFRYLCDGREWLNDNQADAYVANPFGSGNCVIVTDPSFQPHLDGRNGINETG